ncbi:MAG: ABC transporter permease [Fuerstiella sp.]|nr:ABC transporter permease [Fuerstiella sp.]MCP4855459.1 ABC transporter permease [Fuerstiella sp.]
MNLFSIAWKSVKQRKVASLLTALSVALGVMLMVVVLVIAGAVDGALNQRSIAYDLIIGAKGSDLQLVLSSVYRVQPPIANLPYMYLEQLRNDRRIETAIPLAFGDFTKPEHGGFPIVGTTNEYFLNEYTPGKMFEVADQEGTRQLSELYDAVIGSQVAYRNDWKVGDQFSIVHGSADSEESHDELFTIVSVLRQTGTPNDRSVFLNLEAVYILDGHQKPIDEVETRLQDFYGNDPERLNITLGQMEELKKRRAKGQEIGDESMGYGLDTPDAMKEITAVYVKTREVFDAISLQSQLKNGSKAMAVNPIRPIKRLMTSFVGPIMSALMVLTGMIIVVSGISIFVSIYNSMSDRKREIGIMRALGARRSSVFSIILAESTVLCVGGGLMGWLIGHGLSVAFAPYVSAESGLLLDGWALNPMEFVLFPVLLVLGALVGFLPAMTAYRTNVADALTS